MTYTFPDSRIVIFAKAPIAGKTKTRLQPELSPKESAKLQTKFIHHISQSTTEAQLCPVELWYSEEHDIFSQIKTKYGITLHPQTGADLGERMLNCLNSKPNIPSLIIGTDCPYIQESHLKASLQHINDKAYDLCITPATDGGYVSIASKSPLPQIFSNIDWGSSKVLEQTLAQAEKSKATIKLLESLADVDIYEDYLQMSKNIPNLAI